MTHFRLSGSERVHFSAVTSLGVFSRFYTRNPSIYRGFELF